MERARNWFGTLNNPDMEPEDFIKRLVTFSKAKFAHGQLEKGAEGTPHIQFVVGWKDPKKLGGLKKIARTAHWEECKSVAASITYCQKSETRIDGPWTYGDLPKNKQECGKEGGDAKAQMYRDALELAKGGQLYDIEPSVLIPHLRNLKVIAADHVRAFASDDTRGIWIYGQPGHGKSYYARSYANGENDIYLKPQSKWWDGYLGQKIVILDDLDSDCLAHHIKIWADQYACAGEFKGGSVALQHTHFIITSNFRIDELFAKLPPATIGAIRRRFEIVDLVHRVPIRVSPRYAVCHTQPGRSLVRAMV